MWCKNLVWCPIWSQELRMGNTYRSRTRNFPPQSHRTDWFLPLLLLFVSPLGKSSGSRSPHPCKSSGKLSSSGWLQSFLRRLMAFSGWESFPRSRAWISGDLIKRRYSCSWRSDSLQKTTCSYLTGTEAQYEMRMGEHKKMFDGQYLDKRSLVLLMMNLVTRPPSSLSFFSLSALTSLLASESLPRIMRFSKFFRKSFFVPRKFGLAKFRREKYSERSFYFYTVSFVHEDSSHYLPGLECQWESLSAWHQVHWATGR